MAQVQITDYDELNCLYCKWRCCLVELTKDYMEKVSRGAVKDKNAEMLKILQLQDKLDILGRYIPEGTVVGTEKNSFATFNYTTNCYISAIIYGENTFVVDDTETVNELVTILNNLGFYAIIVAAPDPDAGIFTIYIENSSCEGVNMIISGTNDGDPYTTMVYMSGGCCTCIAPTPCLDDDEIRNIIADLCEACKC